MGKRFYRGLARVRWLVLVIWIAALGASVAFLPDLQTIVKHSQTMFVPSNAPSAQADAMLKRIHPDQLAKSNAVIVFRRSSGITASDRQWLKAELQKLQDRKAQYGITDSQSSLFDPALKPEFESKDGTTLLAAIDLPQADFAAATQDTVDRIRRDLKGHPAGTTAELTGSAPINIDYSATSQNGVKKSETLTLILVLVILLLVFRSPVAPLIPLVTIGAAFLMSRGWIALAAQHGMPVSNFTETFLVAVLFGAGTDYCILLIHRYREELSKDSDRVEALVRTMSGVGRTVLFAGSTVLIAFFLIGFAKFGLYQSGVGVAIGMAFAILAGLTLTPALMVIFGPAAYWPFQIREGGSHHESRIWRGFAWLTSRKPGLVLLAGIVILAPITLLFHNQRSFDDLAEISPGIDSVAGFRHLEEAFSPGEALPTTVAVQSPVSFRSAAGLAALEKASAALSELPDVGKVLSAARPLGAQIKQLTVSSELEQTNQALGKLQDAVGQVKGGLADAGQQLTAKSGEVGKLAAGLQQMAGKTEQARQGLNQAAQGLDQSRQAAAKLEGGLTQAAQTADSMQQDLQQLAKAHPELVRDPSYRMLAGKQQGLAKGLPQLAAGESALANGLAQALSPTKQIAGGLGQLAQGQTQAASGVQALQQGLAQFHDGLGKSVTALGQVADGLQRVADAQSSIATAGQSQSAGWVLPPGQLSGNADLQKAMDAYLSKDGKTGKLEVILTINPYSKHALDMTDEIRSTVEQSFRGTPYAGATIGVSGVSAQYHDLDGISKGDFYRTGAFVLIGIYIVLALLIQSLLAPLYILLSLLLNYLVAMGLTEFIFVKLLGYPGLSWTVAFFVFVVLVALGVDYSIFLMARFREEARAGYRTGEALSRAMIATGGVILSAAAIMCGTFAALMTSGVVTLLQLGGGIVIGLVLYSTLLLGLIVPSMARLLGRANWWPGRLAKEAAAAPES